MKRLWQAYGLAFLAPLVSFALVGGSAFLWYGFRPDVFKTDPVWDWHLGVMLLALSTLAPVRRAEYYDVTMRLVGAFTIVSVVVLWRDYLALRIVEKNIGYLEFMPLVMAFFSTFSIFYYWPTEPEKEALGGEGWLIHAARVPFLPATLGGWSKRKIMLVTWGVCFLLLLPAGPFLAIVSGVPSLICMAFALMPNRWALYYLICCGLGMGWPLHIVVEMGASGGDPHGMAFIYVIIAVVVWIPVLAVLALISGKPKKYRIHPSVGEAAPEESAP